MESIQTFGGQDVRRAGLFTVILLSVTGLLQEVMQEDEQNGDNPENSDATNSTTNNCANGFGRGGSGRDIG